MLNLTEMRRQCRADYLANFPTIVDTDKLEQLLDIAEAFKEYADALNAISERTGSCADASEIFDRTLKLLEDVEIGDE